MQDLPTKQEPEGVYNSIDLHKLKKCHLNYQMIGVNSKTTFSK